MAIKLEIEGKLTLETRQHFNKAFKFLKRGQGGREKDRAHALLNRFSKIPITDILLFSF